MISELKKGKARTLELQSAHNIITLTSVQPGDCIFLTPVDLDDLTTGDPGIIIDIVSITINMKRMVEAITPFFYEERERMSARIKVKYLDSTMVKGVEGRDWSKPTIVEVVKSYCYHAG